MTCPDEYVCCVEKLVRSTTQVISLLVLALMALLGQQQQLPLAARCTQLVCLDTICAATEPDRERYLTVQGLVVFIGA